MRRLIRLTLATGLTLAAGGCGDAYYPGYDGGGYYGGYGYEPGYTPYGGLYRDYAVPPPYLYRPRPERFVAPPPPPGIAAPPPRRPPPVAQAAPPPAAPVRPPPASIRPGPPPGQVHVPPTVDSGTYARRYLHQRGTPEVGTGN